MRCHSERLTTSFCGCGTALVAAQKLKRQWIGIDVSPTACRVMAKRLRDVCGLPEDDRLWKAGRGFVVRDLPWTEAKLHELPPFEFENWAVIALGGIRNKTQVGDHGIDGRIYPVSAAPERRGQAKGEFEFTDVWYPIQVKHNLRDHTGAVFDTFPWPQLAIPEGSEKVAGGRSAAETPGQREKHVAPRRGARSPRNDEMFCDPAEVVLGSSASSGGIAGAQPPATVWHPAGMLSPAHPAKINNVVDNSADRDSRQTGEFRQRTKWNRKPNCG